MSKKKKKQTVEEFLAAGGKIKNIPYGVSGTDINLKGNTWNQEDPLDETNKKGDKK